MIKEQCDICKQKLPACALDIHHKDCDHNNDKIDNLQIICSNCHRVLHLKSGIMNPQIKKDFTCEMCNKLVTTICIREKHRICLKCAFRYDEYYLRAEFCKDLGVTIHEYLTNKHGKYSNISLYNLLNKVV